MTTPRISVIIPTYQRPGLVTRALHSALAQTLREIEIIVVMDGPDSDTRTVLDRISDSRLRVIEPPAHIGMPRARNVGIAAARADWVALLDDDDEWFAEKLERQIAAAEKSQWDFPVISCRSIVRHDIGDLIWPRRVPRDGEPLSEYLFCQSGVRAGEGLIPVLTILTKTEFMRRVPFTDGLKRHDDLDWLLRASQENGFGVEFVSWLEPLAIWHAETRRPISHSTDWHDSLEWAKANRALMTRRAYVSFVMTRVSESAALRQEWQAFFSLIAEAYRDGAPSRTDWFAHCAIWFVPLNVRRRLTRWYNRWRKEPR